MIDARVRKIMASKYRVAELLEYFFGLKPTPGETFRCPFPDHGSPDQRPSAVLYTATNDVHCFAEGRDYGVVDILLVSGVSEAKIMELALADVPRENRPEIKERKKLEECRKIFQSTAETSVKLFRAGKKDWSGCWENLDAYFANVAGE